MTLFQEFAHLQIPLAEIKSATDNFADENIIGKGGFGNVYKAQLLWSGELIDIAAKRLDRKYGHGDKEFETEISMLSSLNHENLVSFVGYCDEDGEKIIINKYEVNRSLDKYLSDPVTLTWLQRLHICVGAARVLSYIHYDAGRSYSIIHRNIKSSKILLDENWEAKVSGLGFSIKDLATRRNRLVLDGPVGTLAYIDPVYRDTGSVTHKSDVYSFGVMLFEVLCGRWAHMREQNTNQYLFEAAKQHYEEGKLDEIILPNLSNQMHPHSLTIFSETAYHCLQKQRTQRPDMEKVVKRLEKAWELQWKHEHPERNLEHLKIRLADIKLATDNFAKTYYIGSGGYGIVYKAQLDYFDSESPLEIKRKYTKDELPRKRGTVAIKRMFSRSDAQGEQSFFSEIELLTRCKHPNIISLLGFCDEAPERILVYEYVTNGSLDDYLGNTDKMTIFRWVERIKICLDIAIGLNYLHSTVVEKQVIIHRDMKSANIILGDEWEAKIADFGLSRIQHANQQGSTLNTKNIAGTEIYLDREYAETFLLTKESDIYSFAVVIFEIWGAKLGKNWEAKIADFGLSRIQHANQQGSTLNTNHIAGTEVYLDPEYAKTGKLKKESDIYSFGVVMFEILSGKLAYDESYNVGNDKGLPSTVRRFFNKGILKEIVDPRVSEETNSNNFTLNRGPDQDSLDAFLKVAYQCLDETRARRPTIEVVIKELEKALYFQENSKDSLKFSLEDIRLATQNFSDGNLIGSGGFGKVYKGEVTDANGCRRIIAAKLLIREYGRGEAEFLKELEILMEYKHENVIGLVGYCDEMDEKVIVYEYAPRGSLDRLLHSSDLTWMKRLEICIDVACGLEFFHGGSVTQEVVIHRDIKSSNILLTADWEAKISDFGDSLISPIIQEMDYVIDDATGTLAYCDPLYEKNGFLTKESDIYSFGIVLLEILSGRLIYEEIDGSFQNLTPVLKRHFEEGAFDEIVFAGIKKQIVPKSLTSFLRIAYQCLREKREERPKAHEVVVQLKKALDFQERNLEHLKIQLADIKLATDNFAKTYYIGSGGYGIVYKAQLDYFDSESPLEIKRKYTKDELPRKRGTVAIKRMFSRSDAQGEQSFFSEIELLTRCKHPNIISLLGFCDEAPERILVYEYVTNGSLDDYLGNTDKMTIFRWVERIKICLDIANGLNYLHSTLEEKQMIIHRDMKSANILLGKNLEAKIADFGLSKIQHANQQGSTLNTKNIAGTEIYLDPEYAKTGKLKKESDIYSFGVVMFEILSGKLAYDGSYNVGNDKGLPSIVRRFFNEGILKKIVDPRLSKETDSENFTLKRGPNQDSLDAFLKIAYQCLDVTRAKRPTIEVVIKELEKALYFQENSKDSLKFSLEDIRLATQNFSDGNLIGSGGFGKVYKGEVTDANGCHRIIAAKLLIREYGRGEAEFLKELEILMEYKHENVIGLVGYCDEMYEKVIVYEYAPRGSLDRVLHRSDLTWMKRLEICIDVACGLEFFHGGSVTEEVVIHRDIKSSNILLTADWKAKISDFEHTLISPIHQETDYVIDDATSTMAYCDPLYEKNGFLTKESDIYSFGLVLLEILIGRFIYEEIDGRFQNLTPGLKRHYEEGTFDEMVFAGIKEHIVPNSLTTFLRIAHQCLHDKSEERPKVHEVAVQLKIALDFQRDYELWEPKLPKDYKEIIQMSNSPQLYSTEKKEDLYNMFSNGILLQQGKVLLSFEGHGERNELISATKFSYRNRSPHKWRSLTESRFRKVAEMSDISNLMIRIKTKTQFLFPNVVYGVHLVFKFCDSRDFPSKPMYVNLSYRKGNETLHAYFATRRDNEWMMIELYRFLNQKEDKVSKFLIESLSPYYCRDDAIYVEGIEFRAIKKVEREEIEKVKEVHQVLNSNLNIDQVQQILPTESEKFSLSEVNGKKHLMLSAKAALNNFSDLKLYKSKPSTESRFQEVIELLPQQVFRINCKIKSQILSPDTEYACYLVFNLSEECQGLQCPVVVRDLLNREKKESEIIYFVSPNPWNILDITRVREQRKDGWMEVNVWKFNSNQEVKNGCIAMNLNLRSYEGTLSGLIVCGLEFRPM